MTNEEKTQPDFREATQSRKAPKAAVDGVAGLILGFAEVSGTPDQVLRALLTNEVEKWWTIPGVYHLKDWKADLHVQGQWSVTVTLNDGKQIHEASGYSTLVNCAPAFTSSAVRRAYFSSISITKSVGLRRPVVEGAGPQRPAGPVGADDDARGRSLFSDSDTPPTWGVDSTARYK